MVIKLMNRHIFVKITISECMHMQDQKVDNQLNMAIETPENIRRQSSSLNTGYDEENDTWEVIIRYHGSLDNLSEMGIRITPLINGYAILYLNQNLIDRVSEFPEIEYIEKPRELYFETAQGKAASCFNVLPSATSGALGGRGIIIAAIDSGVDYMHPEFRNKDGSTRILYLWDQSIQGAPPDGYFAGTEYDSAEINRAILENDMTIVPSVDISGHGTHVLGIAAGSLTGCAPQADIIVVKLAAPTTTADLMQAVNYAIDKAVLLNMPIAVNISFGNSYGSHSGNSLLETFIDDIAGVGSSTICIGTGNEGASARHFVGKLDRERVVAEMAVYEYTPSFSVQIWKNYYDSFEVSLRTPEGEIIEINPDVSQTAQIDTEGTTLLIYYGQPTPYSGLQEIYIEFIPKGIYFENGIWQFIFEPEDIRTGEINMWLPAGAAISTDTAFLVPNPNVTITIPATSARAISVGAYNSNTMQTADFSGRGYIYGNVSKPEIVAPGVDITSARSGGGYESRTGTSMATPFVTGAAALLMQWGIVEGNDDYLYGQKLKAYLIRGAKPLPGIEVYPDSWVGYGALCVRDSFPRG